jgi:dihydropteroate synthase
MNRKIYYWKLPSTELALGERTLVMGVLNVTPDSFSDGGRYSDPDRAYARALELEEQGADIIDIGAESTRPDSKRISAEEEWRRLAPVLKLLRDKLTVPLSLDTYKSEIAERAAQHGVAIFNDPSGLTFDANLAKVASEHNAGLILNHMRGTPETWGKLPPVSDVMGAVMKDLEATVSRARRAGVEKNRIVIDPGLGFGKRKEQNAEILAELGRLAALDYPILVGPSRKSFLSHGTEVETAFATAAAVATAVLGGAHIVRVHDVKEMRSAVQLADEIVRAGAAHRAALEAKQEAEEQAKQRPRPVGGFVREEKTGGPARPPLRKAAPKAVEPAQPGETPAPLEMPQPVEPPKPADRDGDRPMFRKPAADRPAFRKPASDRPAFRKPASDRPPRQEFRPAAGGDRPPRRDDRGRDNRGRDDHGPDDRRGGDSRGGERPRSFRPGGARPEGGRPSGDRPQGDRPQGDRPQGDRPPRGGFSKGGPPRSGPPRSGPPRSGPPRGAAPRSGPPKNGPPRGAAPRRPQGDRPPRPFRKRP